MTDIIYEDRCPCCRGSLKHSFDYMDHILMESEYDCPKCGWYSHYNTGNYETSFMGRWRIESHYTYTIEQYKKVQREQRCKEFIWSILWPFLKPLFAILNKRGW